MHKLLFTLAVLLCGQPLLMAQSDGAFTDDYRLEFQFSDLKNTNVILGHHFGSKQFTIQEAMVDDEGVVVFEGQDTLRYGLYLVYVPDVKYFDFILNEPEIILSTTIEDPVMDMNVIRSRENEVFFDYLKQLNIFQQRAQEAGEDDEQLQNIDEEALNYIQTVTTINEGLFTASVIRFLQEPRVPEVKPNGEEADEKWKYNYYYERYWDNADLTNERFLYTPWFESRLNRYIEELTIQIPESINKAADFVVSKTGNNREMYRYVVNYITNLYEVSNLMSSEAVFVHMVDNYYSADKAWWVNGATLYRIQDRAEVLRPLLIGKRIPNESFTDVNGQRKAIINTTADYTILYFYDSDCEDCLEGITTINREKQFYRQNNVDVWGIHIGEQEDREKSISMLNMSDWVNVEYHGEEEQLIRKYDIRSKPTIIVIDENKEIVLRRVGPDQLSGLMERILTEE